MVIMDAQKLRIVDDWALNLSSTLESTFALRLISYCSEPVFTSECLHSQRACTRVVSIPYSERADDV
ncbi:hypothetical protein V6N11_056748 [Hibiscus sabdariffa]|uniref:Uncharacterized protein n=1 Tax=Hibiscus sabdariffa TaxID=183260 RepID=A0ABR2T4T1_9ROSI